jgi:hypothetical protein
MASRTKHRGCETKAAARANETYLLTEVNTIHQLAINIQLNVVRSAVSNPDGPATFVTIEMIEFDLFHILFTVDGVHNLDGSVWVLIPQSSEDKFEVRYIEFKMISVDAESEVRRDLPFASSVNPSLIKAYNVKLESRIQL